MPRPREITFRSIFGVLLAGFSLVILLLLAAGLVGVGNIQSIQQNAASMVQDQNVTNHLIDELHTQQTSLYGVFSILAGDPDSVDFAHLMTQLDQADRDIGRISSEGEKTPERHLWDRLRQTSHDFSREARRLLTAENVETYASVDLFRYHEAFIAVVARLIEAEYRSLSAAQAQIGQRSRRLLTFSAWFAGGCVLLAVLFAALTLRMAAQLIRGMEWQTAELARVSWHMLDDQEATARRFSHELHDELGQSLTAVKTNLTALQSSGPAGARLDDCVRLVDGAIGNVRQMSQLLRPTILDDFGLEAGLRWLAEGFTMRTGIDVQVQSGYSGRLPDDMETHLFRIAQEALTNVARHSAARHVTLKLETAGGDAVLTVKDDGRGMQSGPAPAVPVPGQSPAPGGRGLGLIGIRARARSMGGTAEIRSQPGKGVVIKVRAPIHEQTHSHPAR